jgi:DNA-binding NarL/FixJ family response regulator
MIEHDTIRLLTVDDHPLFREGISKIIADQVDMAIVAEAATGRDAIEQFRKHKPDVTLLDIRLPDMSGIDVLSTILTEFKDARALMLTTAEGDVEIQRALQAGARGYMLKNASPRDLKDAIRQIHAGRKVIQPEVAAQIASHLCEPSLTDREIEVLRHIIGGNRNCDIGHLLHISEDTVKSHVYHIMEKLGASDRTEAIAIAIRRGIVEL